MDVSSTEYFNSQAAKIMEESRKKKDAAEQEYVESIDNRLDQKELIQAEMAARKFHSENAFADFYENSLVDSTNGAKTKDSILAAIKAKHLAI